MKLTTPDRTLLAPDYYQLTQIGVYGWKRDNEYLYIGTSTNILKRISTHNIVNKAEKILETDEFSIWFQKSISEAKELEHILIKTFKPKYNAPSKFRLISEQEIYAENERNNDKERMCIICRTLFNPKRYWQKYCSKKCRNGLQEIIDNLK